MTLIGIILVYYGYDEFHQKGTVLRSELGHERDRLLFATEPDLSNNIKSDPAAQHKKMSVKFEEVPPKMFHFRSSVFGWVLRKRVIKFFKNNYTNNFKIFKKFNSTICSKSHHNFE